MDIPWTEDLSAYKRRKGRHVGGRWRFTMPPYTGSIERVGELKKYQRKLYLWRVSAPTGATQILVGKGRVKGTLEQAKHAVEKAIQTYRREQ